MQISVAGYVININLISCSRVKPNYLDRSSEEDFHGSIDVEFEIESAFDRDGFDVPVTELDELEDDFYDEILEKIIAVLEAAENDRP
jgi:hypothetical protein